MPAPQKAPSGFEHDESLIEWCLSLTPTERLAELESRVAFFRQARRNADRELPPNPRDPERHGAEYVVVGGVAAVLQGAPVTTFDIDALLESIAPTSRGFSPPS
jgi:hypothetical protein